MARHLRITSDGESHTTTAAAFLADNVETFTARDTQRIEWLQPGETLTLGGGACPEVVVEAIDCKHCEGQGFVVDDERARIPCEACDETGLAVYCVLCGVQVQPTFADDHGQLCPACAPEVEERDHADYVAMVRAS